MTDSSRIASIDLTRGVVILVILIININYISTPTILRYNPLAFGDFSRLDEWIWFFEYTFIKQRFMPLLALLYGVGIALFCQRLEMQGKRAFWPFLRRSLALIGIGMLHAYLIWDGDVLVAYALCGLVVFAARNWSPKLLFSIGIVLVITPIVPEVSNIMMSWGQLIETPSFWVPDESKIIQITSAFDASWWQLTPARIETALGRQTSDFVYFNLWRCSGLMMLGIAMYRIGLFENKFNLKFIAIYCLIIGVVVSVIGSTQYINSGYSFAVFRTSLSLSFYLGTLVLALAYLILCLIWSQSQFAEKLQTVLQNMGRAALSVYISQNFIAAFIFYGWGLGLYASLGRAEIMLVTLLILALQVAFFNWWINQFGIGPLESIWRSIYQERKVTKVFVRD
ncbi:MAG: DUF418 domain-containing protein [Kangiellaceae bacterium]|nr:DUF418 domain-containing protein [Kangiellaceae bacterium]MCW8999772.1 DUF418 domain-containing protein [Kangiellaceae bacterium]